MTENGNTAMPAVQKVFACVVRDGKLLAFTDHHGRLSIPKGTVEPGEDLGAAVLRELHEESGLERGEIVRIVGRHVVQVHGGPEMQGPLEDQQHTGFLIHPSDDLPDRWNHIVFGGGIDNGFVYCYEWRQITEELCAELAYGADRFARILLCTAE